MTGEAVKVNQDNVREMVGLRDSISGLFDDFFSGRPLAAVRHMQNDWGWCPAVDIRDAAEEIVACVDLPGVDRGDIQLDLKDHTLILSGKRRSEETEEGWLRRETPSGPFYRAFRLPAKIKAGQVTASFKNGILEVRLPKAEEAKPHRVKIA